MQLIHAPQLRRKAKHEARQRQLPRLLSVILTFFLLVAPHSAVVAETSLQDELRAARLMEAALLAQQAGAEEWEKLDRIYVGLIAKYPRDAVVPNARGEMWWNVGEKARAIEAWQAAEKLDPTNAIVLDHLGESALSGGLIRAAANFYARAVSGAPTDAAYHYKYANIAFIFRHELLDEAHPDAHTILRTALFHFAEAARLRPLDPEYARAYAETYYSVPDPDWNAALKAWQHFYEVSPRKDFALLNLARVQIKLGDKPGARQSLARIQSAEFDKLKKRLQERLEAE